MIDPTEIEGVYIIPLKIIKDKRGSVMKMMDDYTMVNDFPQFHSVAEIYFSTILGGVVKGWHGHKIMTLNYACVFGKVRIGLCDLREGSKTFEQTSSVVLDDERHYRLLTIPPGVWNGFKSYRPYSILVNAASHVHSPDEIERIHPDTFPFEFDWGEYGIAG